MPSSRITVLTFGLLFSAHHSARAQGDRSEVALPHLDAALGVTMNTPKDVNQRPQCETLGLPCNMPRTFPDFGLALQAAAYAGAHVGVAGEVSLYLNRWDSTSAAGLDLPRENHTAAWLAGPRF